MPVVAVTRKIRTGLRTLTSLGTPPFHSEKTGARNRVRRSRILPRRRCPWSLPSASSATTSIRLARSSATTAARRCTSNGVADVRRSMIRPLRVATSAGRNFQRHLHRPGAANVVGPGTLRPLHQHSASRFHSVSTLICDELPKPSSSAAKVTAAAQASVASEPAVCDRELARAAACPACRGRRTRQARPCARSAALELRPFDAVRIRAVPIAAHAQSPSRPSRYTISRPQEELRPSSRAVLAVSLPTVALIAIGILAYYVYSPSVHSASGRARRWSPLTPADVNAGGPPTDLSKVGVTASSAPSASVGTGSVAAIGTVKPAPPVEPSTAATSSPGRPRYSGGDRLQWCC